MSRLAMALLVLALAACASTGVMHQPLPAEAARMQAMAYAFENRAGVDEAAIARLDRLVHAGLLRAGRVAAAGTAPGGRIQVTLTHYYMRADAARLIAGILAGRDRIASTVTLFGADGAQLASFEVETTNLSSFGSTQDLLQQHADDIVARLQG